MCNYSWQWFSRERVRAFPCTIYSLLQTRKLPVYKMLTRVPALWRLKYGRDVTIKVVSSRTVCFHCIILRASKYLQYFPSLHLIITSCLASIPQAHYNLALINVSSFFYYDINEDGCSWNAAKNMKFLAFFRVNHCQIQSINFLLAEKMTIYVNALSARYHKHIYARMQEC